MNTHHKTSAVLIVLSSMLMLVLFMIQAKIILHEHQAPSFAISNMIAYGYGSSSVASSSSSAAPVCGNGIKTSLEACDDSNTTAGDGCSASCTVESGYSCVGTTPSVCSTTCGDGTKAGSEACDDHNTTAGDGCSASCTVETGYSCPGTAPSVCSTTCGDGIKAGSEGCDDDNTTASDGCSASCTIESGYSCAGTTPSVCQTGCGDGVVAGIEQCDPDVAGESVSCNNDCTNASCGDSKVNATAGEECDNGVNNASNKACNASCKKTTCGDGVVQTPNGNGQTELCEPALDATCTNTCTAGTGIGISTYAPSPTSSSSAATRLAPPANCGNSILELSKGEECDDGRFNGLSPHCDRWCHTQYCGDNIIQKQNGEECEPERATDGTYITQTCGKVCSIPSCDSGGYCAGGCHWAFLGACTNSSASSAQSVQTLLPITTSSSSFADIQNLIGQGIEDATGPLSGEMQSSSSTESLLLPVASSSQDFLSLFSSSSASLPTCGDGILQAPEQCDDGVNNSDTKPNGCRINCRTAVCGDGVQDTNEECDRGVADNLLGNGCTPTCKVSICGNLTLEPGEECDEGKRNSMSKPDSCSTLCLLPRCGDGIIDTAFGEICDNGTNNNAAAPDACRPNCVPAYCGDGVKDAHEQCDGGPKGNATCTAACIAIGSVAVMHSAATVAPVVHTLVSPLLFLFSLLLLFAHKLQRVMRR